MSCYNILYESDSDSVVGELKIFPEESSVLEIKEEHETPTVVESEIPSIDPCVTPADTINKLWDPSDTFNSLMQDVYMFLTKLPIVTDSSTEGRVFVRDPSKKFVDSVQDFSHELINIVKNHGNIHLDDMLEFYDIISFSEEGNDIPPYRTTLKECFFAAIARANIVVKTRSDYAILDSILECDRDQIRLSALLEARDIENSGEQYKFKDSGVYMKDCQPSITYCESVVYVMKYLRRKKMLNIDYKQFNGSSQIPGLKGLPMEKFNKDRNGVCYNNLWDRDKKFNYGESFYYNRLMALLSFIKFLLYKKH